MSHPVSVYCVSYIFPTDEAIASRAVNVIVSTSNGCEDTKISQRFKENGILIEIDLLIYHTIQTIQNTIYLAPLCCRIQGKLSDAVSNGTEPFPISKLVILPNRSHRQIAPSNFRPNNWRRLTNIVTSIQHMNMYVGLKRQRFTRSPQIPIFLHISDGRSKIAWMGV